MINDKMISLSRGRREIITRGRGRDGVARGGGAVKISLLVFRATRRRRQQWRRGEMSRTDITRLLSMRFYFVFCCAIGQTQMAKGKKNRESRPIHIPWKRFYVVNHAPQRVFLSDIILAAV